MKPQTQCKRLERLLSRKSGTTSMEIIKVCGTVAPHRRMADLEARGWNIRRVPEPGATYLRYFGKAPEAA